MIDKKVYYITSQQGNQTLTAEEYEQQKDSIHKDNPFAVVQEVGQYNEGDEIDDNDKFYLSRPNYAETMELSAQQFRAAYDKIKANYPDAKIARGRTIRNLSSSMQDYNRLQSEIDEYDKAIATDTTSLEETAATQGVGQGEGLAHALDRWKARKAIDDKTKKRDALAAERDNNDYYRAIKESISATNKSDAERVGSLLSQIEADNEGIKWTKMPMGGLGKMPVFPAQWAEASPVVADYHALTLARKAYDEAQEILDAPTKHDGSSNWRGYWQALAKGVPDALLAKDDFDTALQGVMIKAISKAQEGAEEGVELNFFELAQDPERMSQLGLSAAEQELIKAITNKTQIEAMYSSDISAGYQAGQSAAESLPFMRDFILTAGIGSAVGKAITKPLIKKTAEAGLKGIARTGAKLGINTLDATVTTVLRTPLMASSWTNFTDQMTQIDSEGKADMSGEKILKVAGDVFIENLSEMSGRGLNAAGKAVGKAAKPLTKGIAKTKFGEAAKALYNPQVKSWVETAGFNGIFEELGEEWYGNALRTITGVDPNALKNFADLEQQLITLASFGLMTGVSAGTSLAMRGAANLDYEQKKKAFVDYFSKAGYDEETINNILDINAYETPEDLSKGVTPVLKQLAQDNRLDKDAIKVAADLVKATARLKGTQANLEVDLEERRNNAEQELLARLNPEGGEANTYLFSDNRREGDTTPTGRVRVIDKGNKRGYLTTRDEDGVYTIEYTDGTKGFISEAQLQEQNGKTLNDSGWLTRNEYLDQELAALKLDAEQRRIREEGQVAQNLLSRSTQVGQRVNLNTEEAPIYGTILSHTPSGYVVETEDGQAREVSKQEMANHLGISLQGETDAARELREGVEQLAREQSIRRVNDSKGIKVNGQEIVKVLNVRKDESGRWIADAVLADDSGSIVVAYDDVIKGYIESLPVVAEEQQRVDAANAEVEAKMLQEKDGIQRDFRGNPLPLLENGSVDQTALWNADPEAWAKWNDSRNNDNGADSINYITAAINTLANEIAADSQAANAEMQFDVRDTLKAAVAQKQARLETLNGILNGYAQEAEARERANAEKRSVRGILESENNVAPMSVEEAEALDADYNNRYAPAKTLGERANILGEYLGVISNGSIPAIVVTSQNYQQVMTERGCSEANIAKVKEQMDAGLIVDGFTTNGEIYLMVDGISSLEEARITYVHERQHLVNSAYAGTENDRVAELASLGREELLASLAKVCDKAALKTYASLSDKGIADELICRLIERVYTNEDYLVTLGNEGISENVLSIIKTIDNEQRENTNLSNARRGSRRTENESESLESGVAEDERNLGEVSNRVLGEEAVGSAEDSERGVADGAETSEPIDRGAVELLNDNGLSVDEERGDVRFSVRYPLGDKRDAVAEAIAIVTGRDRATIDSWLTSEESLTPYILDELRYLDYPIDDRYEAVKKNSDYPQGTVDFNNICRKRLPFTRMFTRLQRRYPNKVFNALELADIRNIMKDNGLVVACGLCYVEDGRQLVGEVAEQFISELQGNFVGYANNPTKIRTANKMRKLVGGDTYVPSIYNLTTQEGLDILNKEHQGIWEAFQVYNNARGQQAQNLPQGYAEYKREILGWSDAKVRSINNNGGLRIFSYSDFEAHHLLDIIQIIIDCAARGVMMQGYTKVPAFARVMANTNVKLNRSLIPLGDTGIVDGQLAFDPVEGIDIDDPNFLESNDNVGNILIGINDEQIRLAMADPRIHYIIPYHARQKETVRAKLKVGKWTNYISTQNERNLSDGKRVKDNINIYTDILTEDITNERQFVEKYLQLCKEMGRYPKFDQFLNKDENGEYAYTEGYYKFLLDFKLFDESGNILPQKPVIPQFDDAFNQQILEQYVADESAATGDAMNAVYDQIVDALGLDESTAEGEDIRFRITPEQDAEYLAAVERGDMEAAQRMVNEAARLAMPNTKVVDEDGNPRVVYHGTGSKFYTFRNTSESNELGAGYYFSDSYELAERYSDDENLADNRDKIESLTYDIFTEEMGHSEDEYYDNDFIDEYNTAYARATQRLFENSHVKSVFLNIENPFVVGSRSDDLPYRSLWQQTSEAHRVNDGIIDPEFTLRHDTLSGNQYVAFSPSQIKSADPVTYDDNGNVIPLSERFNPENEDIRFRLSNENQAIFVSNAARAVESIKMEKATPEQWLKMIEKGGGLKAGEDKWMGLSDWLKDSDKKTLTKAEVLDFINENMIVIEEQHYAEGDDSLSSKRSEIKEALQGIFDQYVAESEDMNDDIFMSTHYDYAIQKLADDLGYSAFNAPFVNNNAIVELDFYEDDLDTLNELTDKLGIEKYDGVRDINDTRLSYTTEGLTNNHEIALTVPTIEPWEQTDEVHFGDAGDGRAVAWIRFGDAKKLLSTMETKVVEEFEEPYKNFNGNDVYKPKGEKSSKDYVVNRSIKDGRAGYIVYINDTVIPQLHSTLEEARVAMNEYYAEHPRKKFVNERVLVIDEIQSKRHQEGREKGYRVANINKWLKDNNVEVVETGEFFEFIKDGETDRRFSKGLMNYDIKKAKRLYVSGYNKSDIPDAPFDKNWHELAMKRMLRYAAENDYDVVAWTKGEQQAERYNIGNYLSSIDVQDEYDGKKDFGLYVGDSDEALTITVNEEGTVTYAEGHLSQAEGRPLSDLVGKELAVKMMQAETDDVIEDVDIKIGGEGMKGFYDKMLPAFVNKYGKKWGVKVEDITLPNVEEAGRVMHSIPVTEEMKESVMEGQVMFRTTAITPEVREEMKAIKDAAIADGIFMKAPNGKDTNLTEEQWLLVRTKNFKRWFGDWMKPQRIQKLRNSDPVMLIGNEYEGKYELNRDSAQKYILNELRDTYTIADTNERIKIVKKGAKKVTSHSMGNDAHMRSIAIIPEIIKSAIFITEMPAEKADAHYDSYRYYVCGLEYAGDSYTVKMTVGVKNGDYYYDHTLTDIEKGKLLDMIESQQGVSREGFTPTGNESNPSYALSNIKDRKLVSILQNNFSKVIDENGEPKVVMHNSPHLFTEFNKGKIGTSTDWGAFGKGFYFSNKEHTLYGSNRYDVFLNLANPYIIRGRDEAFAWKEAIAAHSGVQYYEVGKKETDAYTEYLKEQGYDGVIYEDTFSNINEYVAFEPNQIKSATDNNGEFSADNDNISFRTSSDDKHSNIRPTDMSKRSSYIQSLDKVLAFIDGISIAEATKMRKGLEADRRNLTKEIYARVLNSQFDNVTLQLIDKYISDATPRNPHWRKISQRLPQEVERSLHEGERESAINALFSRISESAVSQADRASESGRKAIDAKKKELLKNWAIASGKWYTNLYDIPNIADINTVDEGTEADVYASTKDGVLIKIKRGKPFGKRFRQDIDDLALFNHVFPNTKYSIIGYGDFGKGISTIVEQPIVEFGEDSISVSEREGYMKSLGFAPINKEKTAFSNGMIVASDIHGKNIVKDTAGNIRVIDADMKLHTKDVGGKHTIPPVEEDWGGGTLFRTSSDTEYGPNVGILDTVRRINAQNELDVDGVRYRAVTDQETIDWLESGEKYLFYRNVVLFPDGTFGSPMASKLTNKGAAKIKTSGFALNEWEMAEEHPELVKNGKIKIVKPNGKPLDVDYNPYVHSRPNRVNTQFKQAWERPDLIYIETEVSSSDIDEKYHAPEAARPIGLDQDWNGGKLTLSRYDKPVRMVPWAEVADDWMEHFGKKGIHFDIIPPSLLPILAERGAKIIAPHKNMGKECFDAYDTWKANPNEYYASLEIPENVRVLSEDNGVRFKIDSARHEGESDYDYTRRMVSALYKEYKSDVSVATVSWDGGDKDGYYDREKKLIVIYTKKDAKFADIEDTYFHEQVHHALTKLPEEARSLGYRFLAKADPDYLKAFIDVLSKGYSEDEIEEEVTAWYIAESCVSGDAATMLSLISGKGKHYLSEILKSFNYDPIREFNARGGESIGEVEGELAGQRLPQDSRPTNDAGRDGRGVGEDDERSEYDDTSTNGGIDFRTRAFEDEVEASVDLLDTHAIVRENGLAAVLGTAEYNNFIDSLYADANREVRGRIVGYAADHGYNFRNAIARTLANLIAADEQPEFVQTAVDALQQRLGEMPINDAKWMLYLDGTKGGNALDEIRRAQMAHRLGFDTYSIQAKRDLAEDFRLRVSGDMQNRSAIEMYLSSFTPETAIIESHADMYVSVENLLQAIEKSSGSKRATFEDVMLALNQLSSKNFSEKDKYQRDFLDPMWDTINAIISFGRKSLDDVVKYVMLKHGLERNEIMAKDEARSHYLSEYNAKVREIKADESTSEDEKNALIANAKAEYDAHIANVDAGADAIYAENRKADYSGLMAQFYDQTPVERRKDESRQSFLSRKRAARIPKFKTLAEAEAEARRLIDKFEIESMVPDYDVKAFNEKAEKRKGFTLEEGKDHSLTDMLWERINAATKETLRHQLASGMISKKVYDSIANKYQFYVPLRGFKEEEASDLYHYMNQKGDGGFTAPILKAKGRRSLADNPFGMIGSMAESAIQADNKNLAKQKLYYFLSNRPDNGLAEVRDVWYEDTGLVENGKKVFRKRYPEIKEGMTQEEINKAIQDLEDEMKQKKASGVRVVKKKKNLDLQDSVVKIDSNEQAEHIIKVNVLGEEQIIIVNANPRAAQAINGKLNIEADRTFLVRALMAHTRLLSALATSSNPEFVVSNLVRDIAFAQVSTFVEHGIGFTVKMDAKILRLMKNGNIFRLVNKQGGGKGLNIDKTDPDLVAAYDEYVMNGGPTGYTYLTNNAEYDKKMEQYLKRQTSAKATKAVLDFWERFKDTMEAVEQISRFAAYLTAKEEGMSIPEAVNASKEVTLNFNRKGSGKYIGWEEADQFVTSENPIIRTLQKMMITSCSVFAGAKLVTMFYNATVQGISKFIKLFEKSAPKMTAICIGMTMLGMFNAMMHLLWKNDGDDDEKEDEVDDYFNIPTYKRRNSLCLGAGKENRYISIPLSQEFVPFYSLGDMIVTSMIPSTKIYPNSEPIKELAITFGDMLPFNVASVVTDEEGLTHGVVDMIGRSVSAFSTPYSLMENETFFGGSIHPENKYEDEAVVGELAHFNQKREKTAPIYQTIAEGINKATGGDDVKGGIINPYPDDIKFVLGDIIGGAGKFWTRVFDTARNTIKGEETLTDDIPFLNRVMVDTMEKNRESYYHEIDGWLRYEELPIVKEMDERLKENYLQNNPEILAEIEDLEAKKKALGSKRDKASVAARRKLTTQINTLSNPDPAAYAGKYLNDPRFKVWWELKDSLDSKFLTKEIAEIDKRLKAATNPEQQELLKAEKWRLQKRFVEDYRRLLNSYEKQ